MSTSLAHYTVAQIARFFAEEADLSLAFDQALMAFRPAIQALAATEAHRVGLPWVNVGDDFISIGLIETHRFFGKVLDGYLPDNPEVKATTIALTGVKLKIRQWIDNNPGWGDPLSGGGRARRRFRTAMSLSALYQEKFNKNPSDDLDEFLAWANLHTAVTITAEDMKPPATRQDINLDTEANYEEFDLLSGLHVRDAARITIAWADNTTGDFSLAARRMLTDYTTGQVAPLPTWAEIQQAIPNLSSSKAKAMHARIAKHFHATLKGILND